MIFQDLVENCYQNKLLGFVNYAFDTGCTDIASALTSETLRITDKSGVEHTSKVYTYASIIEAISEGTITTTTWSNWFISALYNAKDYKPFVISVNQIIEFMFAKLETEDINIFFNLKMPFDNIFIDFNGTLFSDCGKFKGMFIRKNGNEFSIRGITNELHALITNNFSKENENRIIRKAVTDKDKLIQTKSLYEMSIAGYNIIKGMPVLVLNKDTGAQGVNFSEEKTFLEGDELKNTDFNTLFRKIAIGFCLYVNSINVEVIKQDGSVNQTKKRRQQNRPVPEDYYFCKLETKQVTRSDQGGEHVPSKYQYDVRGHFSYYKTTFKGKPVSVYKKYNTTVKALVLWVPPHRRGLSSGVYRPKTYVVTENQI